MDNTMTNKEIAQILENIVYTSKSSAESGPRHSYDGNSLADKLSVLIQVLKLEEE